MNVSNIQEICILAFAIIASVSLIVFTLFTVSSILKFKKNEEKNSKLYAQYLESCIKLKEQTIHKSRCRKKPFGVSCRGCKNLLGAQKYKAPKD